MNGPTTFSPTVKRSSYLTRHRLGVSLLFLMNGFMMGSWAPKIPEFAARLSLSESALGLIILVLVLVHWFSCRSPVPRLRVSDRARSAL